MENTLVSQNPQWNEQQFSGLKSREIMSKLLEKQSLPHIQILTGVRRCGKSTIFKLLIDDLMSKGVAGKSILTVNVDAPVFIPMWNDMTQLRQVVETAERITGVRVKYLFLDEIQQIKDWEIYVKSVYDSHLFDKIYITGSNSNLLQNRFASMLSGRYFANEVRPFSIKECLSANGIHSILEAYNNAPKVLRMMTEILKYGTFPEIVLSDMSEAVKMELLHSYFESIVQKDCIVYNSIRDSQLFYTTTNYLLQNAGNRFSPQQLASALKSNDNTMNSYLGYLCSSYICNDIRNFSYSLKETRRSDHKCYCIDNGLMTANSSRFSSDIGRFFENLVFNELVNMGYTQISFDNSSGECDFIARKDEKFHAFQVCYELTDTNRQREIGGFNIPKVNLASKTLLTFNQKEHNADITILPLWEWIFNN